MPTIYDLEFDEWNEGEMARHGVSAREVRQVLDNDPRFFPNQKRHAARIVMIGLTDGDACSPCRWPRRGPRRCGARPPRGTRALTSSASTAAQAVRLDGGRGSVSEEPALPYKGRSGCRQGTNEDVNNGSR